MRKNFKNKFAAFMACASVFGGENLVRANSEVDVKNPKTLAAVGGAITPVKNKGLSKNQKIGIAAAIILPVVAAAVGFTIYGIKKHSAKKDDDSNKNDNNNLNKNQKNIDNLKISGDEIYGSFGEEYEEKNNKEEENISNSIKIFNALDNMKIDEKGNKEENNKEKELIVKAFKYFVEVLNGKTVDDLLASDIFNEFRDNDGDEIKSVNGIKEVNGNIVQGLLDIFSDKSKISDIEVEFYPKGELNTHYGISIRFRHGNNEKMIVLHDFVGIEQINIKYCYGKNPESKINFRVSYDKLK